MGITMALMGSLKEKGVFNRSGLNVLDIGSSNLYQADVNSIVTYVSGFDEGEKPPQLNIVAQRLSAGSAYDAVKGGRNESFAGELIENCGMRYLSMDIAAGYKTEILDFNHARLPVHHQGAYDVVLNIGTTEHILNQYNAFKIIHEAVRTGGYMVHQLPVSGYTDHGYYIYASRMFFDLASFNRYEIVDLWYEGPAASDDLYQSAKRYASSSPSVERFGSLEPIMIPNYSMTIIYRKKHNAPFAGMLETSTSVGDIPAGISTAYATTLTHKIKSVLRGSQFLRRHSGRVRALRNILRREKNT